MSAASGPPTAARERLGGAAAWEFALIAVALAACAVVLTTYRLRDSDTFLHLAIGRHIVQTGAVPHSDPFSHTHPQGPFIAQEWLGGVIFYLVDLAGGVAGLIALRVALVLAFVGGWLMLCRGRPGAVWGVGLLAPFVLSFAPRFEVRPYLFSAVLVVWQIVLVDSALRFGRRRLLWPLPVLYALWINLHGGAVMGWAYLAVFTGGLFVQAHLRAREGWFDRADLNHLTSREVAKVFPWVAASAVALFLNPYGWRGVTYVLLLAPSWVSSNLEHASILRHLSSYAQAGGSEVFNQIVLFALVLMVSWAVTLIRLHVGATVLLALTAILTVWRVRNIVDCGLLTVALIGPALGEAIAGALRRLGPRTRRRAGIPITFACVALIAVTAALNFPRHQFGVGIEEAAYPSGAFDFLAAHRPPEGEGFHPLEWGGPILWRFDERVKVYADGLLELYGRDFFESEYARVALAHQEEPSWSEILNRHGVSWILLQRGNPNFGPLVESLYRLQEAERDANSTWALVYFDDTSLLFYRRSAFAPDAWARLRLGFRADRDWVLAQRPGLLRTHPEWRARLAEMIQSDARTPNALAARLLLAMEAKVGSHEHTALALETLLQTNLTDEERATQEHAFGVLLYEQGKFEEALSHLETAQRVRPDDIGIRTALAATLWSLHREPETVAAYEAILKIDPHNTEAQEALREYRAGRLWAEHPSDETPAPASPDAQ